jgi:ubiquitin C-terminal hydrolase
VSIYECLELFRQENRLSKGNEWYCSKCKEHVQAEKKMELYKVPEVLIIQLKRFKGLNFSNEKNFVKVNFPTENFDVTDYVLSKTRTAADDNCMQIEDLRIEDEQVPP